MSFFTKEKYLPDMEFYQEISDFLELDLTLKNLIVESGQRSVFLSESKNEKYVLKVSEHHPTSINRIKREIKLLGEIDSILFPKIKHNYFVTEMELGYFIENLEEKNPSFHKELSTKIISPFFITIEQYIEHLKWDNNLVSNLKDLSLFVPLIEKIFEGLNILWDKKIVHRDIKPDNVLIMNNYNPVIIDLGIAKSLNHNTQNLTPMFVPGPYTTAFASPEQLNNVKDDITYKSDQFSVGVMIYLILTGEFPFGSFEKDDLLLIVKNMKDGNIKPVKDKIPTFPQAFDDFIKRLLSYHPYQRFRTYQEIEKALSKIKENL